MHTIKDIAKQVGVSAATVSNALNGRDNVSDEVRAKILAAAEMMNYVPNINAKLMKLRNTHNIGLFLPYMGGSFYNALIREIYEECMHIGYALIIHVSRNIESQALLANILSCNIDAAVVLSDRLSDEHVPLLETRGVPVVFLDRQFARKSVSSVVINNDLGIRQAVEYLAKTGHTTIAHLHGIQENYDGAVRRQAFIDAMRALGLPVYPELIFDGHFSPYAGYTATRRMLANPDIRKPDAFVCADDEMAIGCIRAYQDMNYVVPRDVSVVGFSSPQGAPACEMNLTSIRYSMQELSHTAISALLNMLGGQTDGRMTQIDTHLTIGSTTQPRRAELVP